PRAPTSPGWRRAPPPAAAGRGSADRTAAQTSRPRVPRRPVSRWGGAPDCRRPAGAGSRDRRPRRCRSTGSRRRSPRAPASSPAWKGIRTATSSRSAGAPKAPEHQLIGKKWQYEFLSTPEMMLALAVIDVGYLSSGICAVFDRGSRRLLVDDNPVLPPICSQVAEEPADGMSARLFGPRIRARLQRVAGRVSIQAKWAHADVDLLLDATRAPAPITAIAPVGPPGRFDFTHKTVLLPAEGEVRAGNVRFPVHGQ